MDFKPGEYKGTIYATDVGESTNKKTPFVKIVFDIPEANIKAPLTLWLTNKQIKDSSETVLERAMETLDKLGFCATKVTDLSFNSGKGPDQNFNDASKEWPLEVDFQTDADGKQTKYLQVKWVKFGGNRMDHGVAQEKFKGIDALWNKKYPQVEVNHKFTSDDVPF